MSLTKSVLNIALLGGGIVLLAFVVGSLVGFGTVWEKVAGDADMGPVDFLTLRKGPKPNQALVCPAELCSEDDIDIESPVYGVDATRLANEAQAALEAMEGGERVDDGNAPTKRRFVFRTRLMKFPDTLALETIEGLEPGTSQIAVYSRSQIGRSDFGVNLERVRALLADLEGLENN